MNRRLTPLLAVIALVGIACQDVQDPTPDFQVRDGVNNPDNSGQYRHLFFLPPIVPNPEFPSGATFDEGLLPYLTVRVTPLGVPVINPDGKPDAAPGSVCLASSPALTGLSVDPSSGQYSVGWQTKKKGSPNDPSVVVAGIVYRICVWVDAPDALGPTPPRVAGYRDVMPDEGGADQPRNTEQDPVYQFGAGSNVNVKFKVLDGLFSYDLCTSGQLGQDYDCTAQYLNTNETAVCDNASCSLTTGVMDEPELFLIEKFATDNPQCFNDPAGPVSGFPLGIDNPQFAGCVRVTLFDPNDSFDGFINSYGTVGACFYPESNPYPLKPKQDESIQMHIQYPGAGPVVWALPWGATGEINDECMIAESQGAGGQVLGALRKVWRQTQRIVNPWFAPPPVYAFHTGFGGHTTLKSTELPPTGETTLLVGEELSAALMAEEVAIAPVALTGTEKVFHLAWALPAQMAPATFCGGAGCTGLASSPLTVSSGDPVTVAVRVTDNGAEDDGGLGRVLGDERSVQGASVHFAVDGGAPVTRISDTDGIASFTFNAPQQGTRTVTASAFGIASTGGPFDAFVNGVYVDQPTQLQLGQFSFDVRVCPRTPMADGTGDYAVFYEGRAWESIPVNLGGSITGTARLIVANDCDSLYIAFAVPGDVQNTTSLRFVFDNVFGNGESADDDILSLTNTGAGLVPQDRHLSAACLGSKQADCGPLDTQQNVQGGAGLVDGTPIGLPAGSWFLYELKHPLQGDANNQDFTRVNNGDELGYYLALYLGNGTKANAEWPDQKGNFKRYARYTVIK